MLNHPAKENTESWGKWVKKNGTIKQILYYHLG